jgi:hypothetical protein
MKKLLFLSILAFAFACGHGSRRDNNNEAGTNTEEDANTNAEETVSPDTTDVANETDTSSVDGNQ